MRGSSPHAPQDLKEDQILSVQDGDDDGEDGDQKTEEEHEGLDDHGYRGETRASVFLCLHPVQHPTTLLYTLHIHLLYHMGQLTLYSAAQNKMLQ